MSHVRGKDIMPSHLDSDSIIILHIVTHPANFIINQNEYLVPLATEEPSVIAACSNAASLGRKRGGFTAKSKGNTMRTQIQLIKVKDLESAKKNIQKNI